MPDTNQKTQDNLPDHAYYGLFSMEILRNKEMNSTDKIVLQFMLQRFNFFLREGKKYFDTQPQIAEACGISVRTVISTVANLEALGYIRVTKNPDGSGRNNIYEVWDVIKSPSKNFKTALNRNTPKKKEKDGSLVIIKPKVIKKKQTPSNEDAQDGDVPFTDNLTVRQHSVVKRCRNTPDTEHLSPF